MRSIEYLIQLFPDKTGKQILEFQERDKLQDEKEFNQRHSEELSLIEDLNNNGGYYKGHFGLDQCFYYSFSNLRLEANVTFCDVEKLVAFNNYSFSIEFRKDTYKRLDTFGINIYERVTKEEFDKAVDYYKASFGLFWNFLNK